jgi:hypothetical protein
MKPHLDAVNDACKRILQNKFFYFNVPNAR